MPYSTALCAAAAAGLLAPLAPVPAAAADKPAPKIRLAKTYGNLKLNRPIGIVVPPDGSGREFFVQQTGQIFILPKDKGASQAETFIDFSDRKMAQQPFEEGLLNITFHPKFKENRKFYLYYSQQGPKRSVISEMKVSADNPNRADTSTERVLMEVRQPFWNHNSGNMLFGPDGMLYIFFGDGGKANDPHNLAQNLWVLNGKVIRIDVDGREGKLGYGIPEDNPFVGKEGIRPEIWAYGLRNPWGVWFDPENGDLWLADVGQNLWEEIDLITKGGNYGWNFREGAHDFAIRKDKPPEGFVSIDPVHEYPRKDGISITGGLIYRGDKIPALKGWYIYGDWGFGTVWALRMEGGKLAQNEVIYQRPRGGRKEDQFRPTAFCAGAGGELYALSWDGKVYEVLPAE